MPETPLATPPRPRRTSRLANEILDQLLTELRQLQSPTEELERRVDEGCESGASGADSGQEIDRESSSASYPNVTKSWAR